VEAVTKKKATLLKPKLKPEKDQTGKPITAVAYILDCRAAESDSLMVFCNFLHSFPIKRCRSGFQLFERQWLSHLRYKIEPLTAVSPKLCKLDQSY